MKRTAWANGYSGISVVLVVVVEEVLLVVEVVLAVEEVVLVVVEEVVLVVEEAVRVVDVAVVVVVVFVVVLLPALLKSSLVFAPVNDTVFVIEPNPEPEAVTVIVPEVPIGNA